MQGGEGDAGREGGEGGAGREGRERSAGREGREVQGFVLFIDLQGLKEVGFERVELWLVELKMLVAIDLEWPFLLEPGVGTCRG